MSLILVAVISLGAIGLISAVILYVASKKFAVYEDPRIAQVAEVLPQANCGGCGFPGCSGFAGSSLVPVPCWVMVMAADSVPQRMVMTAFREVGWIFSVSVAVMVFLPALPKVGENHNQPDFAFLLYHHYTSHQFAKS